MRSHLAIMRRIKNDKDPLWFYLPGQWILQEAATAVSTWDGKATLLSAPSGSMTPVELSTADQWRNAYVSMRRFRASTYLFKVAGRTIKKWSDGNSGGHADGFYMSDVALSGTDPVKKGESNRIWTRKDGASYREFAKFVASCMPKGNELAWSEEVANNIRQVMTNKVSYSAQLGNTIYSALPLLSSVMYVAEPGRNARAWIVGLMMLDLIGTQYNVYKTHAKYYTWDKVLAHPERIDPGYKGSDPVSKPQKGPSGRKFGKRGAPVGHVPLTTKKQLVGVEGKLPASPSGSASSDKAIDVAHDYIQMKELSLVLRWLQKRLHAAHQNDFDLAFVTWRDKDSLDGLTDLTNDGALNVLASKPLAKELGVTAAMMKDFRTEVQKEIRGIFDKRCSSLDAM
jgi:hypothetical protein